jgi:hypothetical protein
MSITVMGKPSPIRGVPLASKPIKGVPVGAKVRCRFRNNDWARIFIKTAAGIRHFILVDCGDEWGFDYEQGRNERV